MTWWTFVNESEEMAPPSPSLTCRSQRGALSYQEVHVIHLAGSGCFCWGVEGRWGAPVYVVERGEGGGTSNKSCSPVWILLRSNNLECFRRKESPWPGLGTSLHKKEKGIAALLKQPASHKTPPSDKRPEGLLVPLVLNGQQNQERVTLDSINRAAETTLPSSLPNLLSTLCESKPAWQPMLK